MRWREFSDTISKIQLSEFFCKRHLQSENEAGEHQESSLYYFMPLDATASNARCISRDTLMVSKVSSTLKGIFYPDTKYRYTCPELKVNMMMDPKKKIRTVPWPGQLPAQNSGSPAGRICGYHCKASAQF